MGEASATDANPEDEASATEALATEASATEALALVETPKDAQNDAAPSANRAEAAIQKIDSIVSDQTAVAKRQWQEFDDRAPAGQRNEADGSSDALRTVQPPSLVESDSTTDAELTIVVFKTAIRFLNASKEIRHEGIGSMLLTLLSVLPPELCILQTLFCDHTHSKDHTLYCGLHVTQPWLCAYSGAWRNEGDRRWAQATLEKQVEDQAGAEWVNEQFKNRSFADVQKFVIKMLASDGKPLVDFEATQG